MPPLTPLRLSGSRLATAAGLVGPFLVLLAAAVLLLHERDEVIERQRERQTLQARVLEDHATRTLDATFVALNSIAEPAARGAPPEVLQALLVQTQASLPQLRGVALLDPTGRVLAAADPADRGLRFHLAGLGGGAGSGAGAPAPTIGPYVAARSLAGLAPGGPAAPPGVGFVPLLRPVRAGAGPALLLVGLLNPDALANFQQLTLADDPSAAALVRLDGELLAATSRVPLHAGGRLPELPAIQRVLKGAEHGELDGTGLLGPDQLVAYRALRERPLVVLVETPRQAVDALWWQRSRGPLAVAVLAAVALGLLARMAASSLRGRERARAALDRAQQQVLEHEQELLAQLGLARSLLASSPLPMSVLDRANRYIDVNHAWESFTGRRRDDVIGHTARSFLPREDAALHDERDAELLRRGGELRYESVWHDADGRSRDLYINKATFPGPDGQPAGIVVCFMDISDFREAERVTRAARDAALDASRAKSEFIANVSHELRTPLQSILGFSELGLHRAREHPRLAEMFGDVHRAGQRMLTLVNDLLDLSKIESPVERLQPQRQDLRPLLQGMAAELRPLLEARQLRVETRLPAQELVAQVDASRLQQVLRNLLANAIKFSPTGGLIELTAHQDLDRQRAVVEVADRGPGVPEAELEHIFDAFVQSSATKDGSGGSGLGLAICRRLVEAHDGRISAHNRPGGGAVFSLWLPLARFGDTQPASL